MTHGSLSRTTAINALSGYSLLLLKIFLGLITFRLLYQGLGADPERFGFWGLLWAVFGYGILLDFGFGYAAQKSVAELSVRQDWDRLSRVLSTIFFYYLFASLVIVTIGIFFSEALIGLFNVSARNHDEFRSVLIVFLIGMGAMFPLGILPEILKGQQRTAAANHLSMAGTVANFAVVVAVVWFKLSFMSLVAGSLACILVANGIAAKLAFQKMPQVRIHPKYFSFAEIVNISRFSLFAYCGMLSNVVRVKLDQPIISAILGVAFVTPYQAGGKVGEMFGMFTRQIADALSPAAAHLHAKDDREVFREMLFNGMRYSLMVATPLVIVTAVYMKGLIRLLTGMDEPTPAMIWTGELLLCWYYSLALTHRVFKSMAMMAGQEKRLMVQGVCEAAANLILSVVLTVWIKRAWGADWAIVGVALGSLLPTAVFGWSFLWRWTARELGIGYFRLFGRIVIRIWAACLPVAGLALWTHAQLPAVRSGDALPVLTSAAASLLVGVAGIWFWALSPGERRKWVRR